MILISAIVVSFNTREITLRCLRDLKAEMHGVSGEVWVVDNASTDGSVGAIREAFPEVKVIESGVNLGFAAANNRAMAKAEGEYFLLLNSDAFLKTGAIAALLGYMQDKPRAGVAGPRLLNADGTLQVSCHRFPTPSRAWVENLWISAIFSHRWAVGDYRRWGHDQAREVDWVVGACLMVRREVVETVGGFDEAFFMYAEESDWQRRIRNAGWGIEFTPAAEVVHLGGASGLREKPRINRHFFESLDYYEQKHHGRTGLLALRAAMVVGCALRLLAWGGVWVIRPGRRELARGKLGLLRWLIVRQATYWRKMPHFAGGRR